MENIAVKHNEVNEVAALGITPPDGGPQVLVLAIVLKNKVCISLIIIMVIAIGHFLFNFVFVNFFRKAHLKLHLTLGH